jgi:hypothetical protein
VRRDLTVRSVRIVEFRYIVPLSSVSEYDRGACYVMGQVSERETSGGEGVEFVSERREGNKRVTVKRIHLKERLPFFVRYVLPKTAFVLTENAWRSVVDAASETVISNAYMGEKMTLKVETRVFEQDAAAQENVFALDAAQLKLREVELIDWVAEHSPKVGDKDYVAAEDARVFKSQKTGKGPLPADWQKQTLASKATKWVCVYKLLTFDFVWFGIQTKAEQFLVNFERGLFTRTQRLIWTMQDDWHDMTDREVEAYLESVGKRLGKQFGNTPAAEAPTVAADAVVVKETQHEHEQHHEQHHHHHHHQHRHKHDEDDNDDDAGAASAGEKKKKHRKRKTKKAGAAAVAATATQEDADGDDADAATATEEDE